MAYAAPVWRNLRRDIPSLRAVASHSSRATFMIAFCSGVGSGGMNSSFDTGRTSIGKRSLSDSSIRSWKRFGISPSLRSRFSLPTRSSSRARLPDDEPRGHRPEIADVRPAVPVDDVPGEIEGERADAGIGSRPANLPGELLVPRQRVSCLRAHDRDVVAGRAGRVVVGIAAGDPTKALAFRFVEDLGGGVARVHERQQAGRRLQVEPCEVVERIGESERPERAARDRHRNRPTEDGDGELVALPGEVSIGRDAIELKLGGGIFGNQAAVTGAVSRTAAPPDDARLQAGPVVRLRAVEHAAHVGRCARRCDQRHRREADRDRPQPSSPMFQFEPSRYRACTTTSKAMNAGNGVPAPRAERGIRPMSTPLGGPSAGSVIWITESEGEPSGNLFTTKIRFVAASYATPSGAPPATAVGMRTTSGARQVGGTP